MVFDSINYICTAAVKTIQVGPNKEENMFLLPKIINFIIHFITIALLFSKK